jgi:uncharacterized membrane protein YeiH
LALLVTIGVQKAGAYHTPGPPAILIGVVAATAGGVIDDLLTGRRVAIMVEGPWLLSVIVCGAVIFWLFTLCVDFYTAVVVTVVVVTSLRALSVRFGWTTPFFPSDRSQDRE